MRAVFRWPGSPDEDVEIVGFPTVREAIVMTRAGRLLPVSLSDLTGVSTGHWVEQRRTASCGWARRESE